jgi:hypothetical protein
MWRLTILLPVLIALASQSALGQDEPPLPVDPLPKPDWLAVAPPCQQCPGGGYAYDGLIGPNGFSNWYVRGEVLFLHRNSNVINQTVVQTAAGGTPVVSTADFDFPMVAGLSLLVGHRLDSNSAWELSYFGLHNWSRNIIAADADNLDAPGGLGTGTDFDAADVMNVEYLSRLNNVEFNILRDQSRLAWLAGFRYVNWEEEFNIQATNDTDVSNYKVGTSNNLFGGQFGARAFFPGYSFDWDVTGKVGLFGNAAQQRQLLADDNDTVVLRNTSVNGGAVSFVGDLNASLYYRLNRTWGIRGGYNIMLITGLALAPDQLDFTNTPVSGLGINRSGDVFLHGANVGVEAIW